eukprot:m.1228611 g.1228611  ORF g.1228611 m.1228611 type:complete len:100 (+) comp24648_c1_seq2:1873-2172(+)
MPVGISQSIAVSSPNDSYTHGHVGCTHANTVQYTQLSRLPVISAHLADPLLEYATLVFCRSTDILRHALLCVCDACLPLCECCDCDWHGITETFSDLND